jgi:hypothetical protein
MALDSLLALLKSGVAEVTGVQASCNTAFTRNPMRFERVAEATASNADVPTATLETLAGKSEVTGQPGPTGVRTRETSVTPKTIKCDVALTEGNPCETDDTATASRYWLIHHLDRNPSEVVWYPAQTHMNILERYPDAVAAEPSTPVIRRPANPLTAPEEMAVRAWLRMIEEVDPVTIAKVISDCQKNAEARDYFIAQAVENNLHKYPADMASNSDLRTCVQCVNLTANRCRAAKRGEILAPRDYVPVRDLSRRCEGYEPRAGDPDPRHGRERWPGLIRKGTE